MIKIAYRNDSCYKGVDIKAPEQLLPYILKGVIDSMHNCSVVVLYIDYFDLPKASEDCKNAVD